MRGKHNKLGEGERKVRLGQDSLPNIAISVAETSGNYIHCFTQTLKIQPQVLTHETGKDSDGPNNFLKVAESANLRQGKLEQVSVL